MVGYDMVPEGCIADVLSLTTPKDACRMSLVSTTFRSAAESDAVWDHFLPPDYQEIIARSTHSSSSSSSSSSSKKDLYLRLCNHPLIIDSGTKGFWLEKWSGKKCYMLAARDLAIVWGDTPRYWRWAREYESRFGEVAALVEVCWLEIKGKIKTCMLSEKTKYGVYLVYKCIKETYGFEHQAAEGWVGTSGSSEHEIKRKVFLDPRAALGAGVQAQGQYHLGHRGVGIFNHRLPSIMRNNRRARRAQEEECYYSKEREDRWLEIELGEYDNNDDGAGNENVELAMGLMEIKSGGWKSGLIVQGIEIRPKYP